MIVKVKDCLGTSSVQFSSVQCVVLKYFGEVVLPTVLCGVEDWLLVHTPVVTTYTSELSQA
jgi:hypothetical protein